MEMQIYFGDALVVSLDTSLGGPSASESDEVVLNFEGSWDSIASRVRTRDLKLCHDPATI